MTASHADESSGVDWPGLARGSQTLVVYMGSSKLAEITRELIANGRQDTTAAAVIMQGTRPEQKIVGGTLTNIARLSSAAGIKAPAVLIVGAVAQLAEQLHWYYPDNFFDRYAGQPESVVSELNNI